MFTTGETVDLAEWIIDEWWHLSCVILSLNFLFFSVYVSNATNRTAN